MRTGRIKVALSWLIDVAMILAIAFSLYVASSIARAPAELPVRLPQHPTTMPAQIKAVETVQRVYMSDGTTRESSLGVVSLDGRDDFSGKK